MTMNASLHHDHDKQGKPQRSGMPVGLLRAAEVAAALVVFCVGALVTSPLWSDALNKALLGH